MSYEEQQILKKEGSEIANEAINYTVRKIEGAKEEELSTIRIWTGIPYGQYYAQEEFKDYLNEQGYNFTGEDQVRHGYVIDIEFDYTNKPKFK